MLFRSVKRRKGNREIIPSVKDHKGTIIVDSTGKPNILISYYASVFCCDHNIPKIQLANCDHNIPKIQLANCDHNIPKIQLANLGETLIGRKKSVGKLEFLVKF